MRSFLFEHPVGGRILGAGPVALRRMGTDPQHRSESLGLGPTVVAIRQEHGWTYDALVNDVWPVTNSDDQEQVSGTFLQPFGSHTWPSATTMGVNIESTDDGSSDEWMIPLSLQFSQLMTLGDPPVQFTVGERSYAESPDDGAEWGFRFTITILLPN